MCRPSSSGLLLHTAVFGRTCGTEQNLARFVANISILITGRGSHDAAWERAFRKSGAMVLRQQAKLLQPGIGNE